MRSKLQNIMAATALNGLIGSVAFAAVKTAKGYSYTATVGLANAVPAVVICDSKGKVRLFTEIDNFYTEAAKLSVVAPTVEATVSNMALLSPAPFTGDIIKKNTALVASYVKQLADSTALVNDPLTGLDKQILLLQGEVTTAPAYLAEKVVQRDSVVAINAWLTAEITRINTALGAGSIGA